MRASAGASCYVVPIVLLRILMQYGYGVEKISSKWEQKPPYYLPAVDVSLAVNEIQSLNLGSSSIIYSRSLNSKFDWSLGIHYNRKGFKEIGIANDFGFQYAFSQKRVFDFIGVLSPPIHLFWFCFTLVFNTHF